MQSTFAATSFGNARLIIGAIAMLALTTGPSSAAENAGKDELVTNAGKEGKIVIYNAGTQPIALLLAKRFEEKYGIEVDVLKARSSEIRERIRSEQAAGRSVGDLTITAASTGGQQRQAGVFRKTGDLSNAGRLVAPFKRDDYLVPLMVSRQGLLINTAMVKPEDEPKSWNDLLDPKWQGKLLSEDPRSSGGGHQVHAVLYNTFGRAFAERIAAQKLVLTTDSTVNQRRVGRGEMPMVMTFSVQDILNLRGMPVKIAIPKEGAPYIGMVVAALKDAPHPNASRLFLDFVLSEPAQAIIAQQGYGTTTGTLAEDIPDELKPFSQVKLMGQTDWARQDEMMATMKDIFHDY